MIQSGLGDFLAAQHTGNFLVADLLYSSGWMVVRVLPFDDMLGNTEMMLHRIWQSAADG